MLDIKFIAENIALVKRGAEKKNIKVDIDKIISLDSERRLILTDVEAFRAKQNAVSKEIPQKQGEEKNKLLAKMKLLKDELKIKEQSLEDLQEVLDKLLLQIPNPPFDEVPDGKGEEDNIVVDTYL